MPASRDTGRAPSYDPSRFDCSDPTKLQVATIVYELGASLPAVHKSTWDTAMTNVLVPLREEEERFMEDSVDYSQAVLKVFGIMDAVQEHPAASATSVEVFEAMRCLGTFVLNGSTSIVEQFESRRAPYGDEAEQDTVITKSIFDSDRLHAALEVARLHLEKVEPARLSTTQSPPRSRV